MYRLFLQSTVLVLLVLHTACTELLFDDRCGPESRETEIGAEIRDAMGMRVGTATIRLVEVRGEEPPRKLHPIIMGPAYGSLGAPLKGHVTRARLMDSAGELLFELSVVPGLRDEVLQTTPKPIADGAVFDKLKRRFIDGMVVLDLETDLVGTELERLRTALPLRRAGRWDRAHCS
jgi:hypothetical protein